MARITRAMNHFKLCVSRVFHGITLEHKHRVYTVVFIASTPEHKNGFSGSYNGNRKRVWAGPHCGAYNKKENFHPKMTAVCGFLCVHHGYLSLALRHKVVDEWKTWLAGLCWSPLHQPISQYLYCYVSNKKIHTHGMRYCVQSIHNHTHIHSNMLVCIYYHPNDKHKIISTNPQQQ